MVAAPMSRAHRLTGPTPTSRTDEAHLPLSADPPARRRSYNGSVRAVLRSFWNEPAVADPPRRVWRDWALVAVLAPLCVIEVLLRPDMTFRWASFAVALAGVPLLLWRRTHPLAVTGAIFGAAILLDLPWIVRGGDPPGLYTMGYVLLLSYALFRWAAGRHATIGLAVMLVNGVIFAIWDYTTAGEAIGGFAILFGTAALGLAVRYRARVKVKEVDEIRARERERIARDLHDTVAHHVSAIAIRAQAGLALSPTDPDAAVEALRVIDAEASRTLAEMRTIVRDLRGDEGPELAPLPQIPDVRALAGVNGGGPRVHVALEGDPSRVPAPVSTAAYRLAQESVTNARRHARRASRIDVVVRTGADAVTVEVTDDGEAGGVEGRGFGIVGMVERAERLGGSCSAGPRDGRGWSVRAVLPLGGAST